MSKIPDITQAVKYQINRIYGLLDMDKETLRDELKTSLEIAFYEGYAAANKNKEKK